MNNSTASRSSASDLTSVMKQQLAHISACELQQRRAVETEANSWCFFFRPSTKRRAGRRRPAVCIIIYLKLWRLFTLKRPLSCRVRYKHAHIRRCPLKTVWTNRAWRVEHFQILIFYCLICKGASAVQVYTWTWKEGRNKWSYLCSSVFYRTTDGPLNVLKSQDYTSV